jgi:phosphatidylserine/phosphatidylglycerophosphate/cardiolipin synthase-like enzyme
MTANIENRKKEPELVITIPSSFGPELANIIEARITIGVIIQLIAQSKKIVIIGAPFIQRAISEKNQDFKVAINSALNRDVQVNIISTGTGLDTFPRGLKQENIELIHYFQPQRNIDNKNQLGSHAKFCISDGKHAYIGSANLTDPGLFENLEMGILIHGNVAKQALKFWEYLVDKKFFIEVDPR